VVFHTSPQRNMQLIFSLAPESVNFAEVNVRILADTSDQSIQMVSQIFFVMSVYQFLFIFFFGYFLGWSVGGSVKEVRGLGP